MSIAQNTLTLTSTVQVTRLWSFSCGSPFPSPELMEAKNKTKIVCEREGRRSGVGEEENKLSFFSIGLLGHRLSELE